MTLTCSFPKTWLEALRIADGWQTKQKLFAPHALSKSYVLTMPSQQVCTAYGVELQTLKESAVRTSLLPSQKSCQRSY
jgi:hypothetical protein